MPCIGQLLVSRICAQISTKPRRADPLIRKSFVVYGVTWQFITVQGTKLRAVLTSVSFQCEKSCRDTVHTSHFRPYLKAMGSQSDQNRRRESQQFQTARRQEDQTHPRLARRQQPGFRCSCHREHPTNDHSRVKQPEYTFSKQHRIPTEIEPEFRSSLSKRPQGSEEHREYCSAAGTDRFGNRDWTCRSAKNHRNHHLVDAVADSQVLQIDTVRTTESTPSKTIQEIFCQTHRPPYYPLARVAFSLKASRRAENPRPG